MSIKDQTEQYTPPTGTQSLTGILRAIEDYNGFVPDNDPAHDAWYKIDLTQMSDAYEEISTNALYPYVFFLEDQGNANQGNMDENDETVINENPQEIWPLAQATRPEINNNHRQYAFFWFSMMLAITAVFIGRFVLPPSTQQK